MKKKEFKALLPVIIASAFALLALLMVVILEGVSSVETIITTTTSYQLSFKDVIFGNGTSIIKINNAESAQMTYGNGASTFGIISLIVLVLGILTTASSIFFKDKKMQKTGEIVFTIGNLLMILSALFMLMLLSGGGADVITAEIGNAKITVPFAEYFEGYTLSAGPIVYAVLSAVGGIAGISTKLFVK